MRGTPYKLSGQEHVTLREGLGECRKWIHREGLKLLVASCPDLSIRFFKALGSASGLSLYPGDRLVSWWHTIWSGFPTNGSNPPKIPLLKRRVEILGPLFRLDV